MLMMKPACAFVLLAIFASQCEAATNFHQKKTDELSALPNVPSSQQHGPKNFNHRDLPKARHLIVERKLKSSKKKKTQSTVQESDTSTIIVTLPGSRADPEGEPVGTTSHDMFCYQNPDDPACYCYHNPREQGCSEKFCADYPNHTDCLCVSSIPAFEEDNAIFPTGNSDGSTSVACKRKPSYCELFPFDLECQCYFHPDSDPYCQSLRCESTPEDPDCRCFNNGYDDPECACELWGEDSYECECSDKTDDRECYCRIFGYNDPDCACDIYDPDSPQCQCSENSSLEFCYCFPSGVEPLYEDPSCVCTIFGESSYDCACNQDPSGETCRCFQEGYDDPACACTLYGDDSLECKCSLDNGLEECQCLEREFSYGKLECACALYGSESPECQCAATEDAISDPCFCDYLGWANVAECGCQIYGEDSPECLCATNSAFDPKCECLLDPDACYYPPREECNSVDGDYEILIQGPTDVDGDILIVSSHIAIRNSAFGVGQARMCATTTPDSAALPFRSTNGHVVIVSDMSVEPKTFTGALTDGHVMNGSLTCWEGKLQFGLVDVTDGNVYMVTGTRTNAELNPETGCPEVEAE